MSSLFELAGQAQLLYEIIESDDGSEEAINNALEQLTEELQEKTENYVALIQRLDMEAERAEELSGKYADIAQSRKNFIKRLKNRAADAMIAMNAKELYGGDFKLVLKGNGGLQPLKITGDVPVNMTKVKIEPDNDKIREFLKTQKDEACAWAKLDPRGTHVEVKEA